MPFYWEINNCGKGQWKVCEPVNIFNRWLNYWVPPGSARLGCKYSWVFPHLPPERAYVNTQGPRPQARREQGRTGGEGAVSRRDPDTASGSCFACCPGPSSTPGVEGCLRLSYRCGRCLTGGATCVTKNDYKLEQMTSSLSLNLLLNI